MNRYVALLRGINISGKNKIAMSNLHACFVQNGYSDVKTYLNSGNVLFSCDEKDEVQLAKDISDSIKNRFDLNIPVFVILQRELQTCLQKAPAWWQSENKDLCYNLIFVLSPATPQQIAGQIGAHSDAVDQIQLSEKVLYWTFERALYRKSTWWKKTAIADICEQLTIRTSNTLKKIAEL